MIPDTDVEAIYVEQAKKILEYLAPAPTERAVFVAKLREVAPDLSDDLQHLAKIAPLTVTHVLDASGQSVAASTREREANKARFDALPQDEKLALHAIATMTNFDHATKMIQAIDQGHADGSMWKKKLIEKFAEQEKVYQQKQTLHLEETDRGGVYVALSGASPDLTFGPFKSIRVGNRVISMDEVTEMVRQQGNQVPGTTGVTADQTVSHGMSRLEDLSGQGLGAD